jgi:hypothetical protein
MAFNFEKLRVWQDAIKLTGDINDLIKTFPSEEKFVLATQMQRAALTSTLGHPNSKLNRLASSFCSFVSNKMCFIV